MSKRSKTKNKKKLREQHKMTESDRDNGENRKTVEAHVKKATRGDRNHTKTYAIQESQNAYDFE